MSSYKKYRKVTPKVKIQDLLDAVELSEGDRRFTQNEAEARESRNERVRENRERFKPLYSLDSNENQGELSDEEWEDYLNKVIQTNENAKNGVYANED